MRNLKLHEIIERSESLVEISYKDVAPKVKQLKTYYGTKVFFLATFVSNAIQGGIVVPIDYINEAIDEIALLHSEDNEEFEYLKELYSHQTVLL
jgi:hypothetical protein